MLLSLAVIALLALLCFACIVLLPIEVQQYEVWRSQELPMDPQMLEAFVVEDPQQVNIMDWIGYDFADRHRCRQWSPQLSDLDGCKAFASPALLRPLVPLCSEKVPVLSLVEELEALGWVAVLRVVEHRNLPPKVYDSRSVSRPYLQCLLANTHLVEHGAVCFCSRLSQAHYRLLLKAPATDIGKLSSAQCSAMLKELAGNDLQIAALQVLPTEQMPLAIADLASGLDGDGGPDEPPLAIVDAAGELDGDCGSSADADEEIDGDGPLPITHVSGAVLHTESRITRTGTWAEGWRITCPLHGRGCNKYRAKHLRTEHEGSHAAIYYLGAWIHGAAERTAATHSGWSPSVAEIHAYMLHPDCPG